jgi:hypothetical protein
MEEEKCRPTPSLHIFGIGGRENENDLADQDQARSGQGSCWYRILPFVTDIHHRLVGQLRELIYDLKVEARPNAPILPCLSRKGGENGDPGFLTENESGERNFLAIITPSFRIALRPGT